MVVDGRGVRHVDASFLPLRAATTWQEIRWAGPATHSAARGPWTDRCGARTATRPRAPVCEVDHVAIAMARGTW